MIKINICNDFSDAPGGRYIAEGNYSGEEFRDNILIPKFYEAEKMNEKLEVNFDGCYGFGTSFLEEAFGGLVRKTKKHNVLDLLALVATEDDTLIDLVNKYIKEAEVRL